MSDAAEFWEQRYSEKDQIWSGHPNATLVSVVESFPPGRALDLGCGEGGDSIWLAQQGWQVTAADVSTVAIARGQAAAAERHVSERIDWRVADFGSWEPDEDYDLASACFLHSPVPFGRTALLRRVADHIAPGGHLFVLGHAEPPPWSRMAHEHDHGDDHDDDPDDDPDQQLMTAEAQVAQLGLDPIAWEQVIVEDRERSVVAPDGEPTVLRDAVVLLRRR